jgi:hypothetical protein
MEPQPSFRACGAIGYSLLATRGASVAQWLQVGQTPQEKRTQDFPEDYSEHPPTGGVPKELLVSQVETLLVTQSVT